MLKQTTSSKTFEDEWVAIYLRAKREGARLKQKRAEREMVKLGIVDDTIAWEALIEGYNQKTI